jgi:hypothetical protein
MTVPIGFLPALPGFARRADQSEWSGFTVRSAGFTVAAGDQVLADMTGGAWALKLPPGAMPGASFELMTYGSGLLTIDRNGHLIAGLADDGVITGNTNVHLKMIYLNATYGWVYGGAL